MKRITLCAVLGLSMLTTAVQAQGWVGFKPGAFAKLRSSTVSEAAGMTMESVTEMKTTLKEISATEATLEVETSVTSKVNGMESKVPTQTTITKLPLAASGPAPTDTPSAAPSPAVKVDTAQETLTIGGKPIKCTVSAVVTEAEGAKITAKSWTSDDVPGGLVKSESTTEGGPAKAVIKTELVEFDAKK